MPHFSQPIRSLNFTVLCDIFSCFSHTFLFSAPFHILAGLMWFKSVDLNHDLNQDLNRDLNQDLNHLKDQINQFFWFKKNEAFHWFNRTTHGVNNTVFLMTADCLLNMQIPFIDLIFMPSNGPMENNMLLIVEYLILNHSMYFIFTFIYM